MLKSDVNFSPITVRKADVAGCCSGGVLFFVDRGCPASGVADLYCLKLFLRWADADQLMLILLRHTIDRVLMVTHASCDM